MNDLTHLDADGRAEMVDVSDKEVTLRRAVATAFVRVSPQTAQLVVAGNAPKGDVVGVARIAGIQAAKRTHELIPLCHQLPLAFVGVEVSIDVEAGLIELRAEARTEAQTGVEMEALTAASIAALTIYDMVKGVERGATIERIELRREVRRSLRTLGSIGVVNEQSLDPLGVLADAQSRAGEALELASKHLDPSLVEVLRILGFDKSYRSASGSYLYDEAGSAFLDMHSGEGFASLGHGHPDIRAVLRATLDSDLIDGVQLHYSVLAGMLAEALAARLPAGLDAAFFASTGAEAVDSAMKFARAATGRPRFISCDSSFHGVTLGPLSIVGDEFFKEGFGPLLPGCARVPFGDLARLEAELRSRDVAAFIVEPIQGRLVTLPPARLPRGCAGAVPAVRHAVRGR